MLMSTHTRHSCLALVILACLGCGVSKEIAVMRARIDELVELIATTQREANERIAMLQSEKDRAIKEAKDSAEDLRKELDSRISTLQEEADEKIKALTDDKDKLLKELEIRKKGVARLIK